MIGPLMGVPPQPRTFPRTLYQVPWSSPDGSLPLSGDSITFLSGTGGSNADAGILAVVTCSAVVCRLCTEMVFFINII